MCVKERERERERYLSISSWAPMRGEQNRIKMFDDWCERSNVYIYFAFFSFSHVSPRFISVAAALSEQDVYIDRFPHVYRR
jgi:uncharacterized membrane protein YdjX (TVP38/TMEM64 family)